MVRSGSRTGDGDAIGLSRIVADCPTCCADLAPRVISCRAPFTLGRCRSLCPRAFRRQLQALDREKLDRILREVGEAAALEHGRRDLGRQLQADARDPDRRSHWLRGRDRRQRPDAGAARERAAPRAVAHHPKGLDAPQSGDGSRVMPDDPVAVVARGARRRGTEGARHDEVEGRDAICRCDGAGLPGARGAAGQTTVTSVYTVDGQAVSGLDTGLVVTDGMSVTATATGAVCAGGDSSCPAPTATPRTTRLTVRTAGSCYQALRHGGSSVAWGTGRGCRSGAGRQPCPERGRWCSRRTTITSGTTGGAYGDRDSVDRDSVVRVLPRLGSRRRKHPHVGPPVRIDSCYPAHGIDSNHSHAGPPGLIDKPNGGRRVAGDPCPTAKKKKKNPCPTAPAHIDRATLRARHRTAKRRSRTSESLGYEVTLARTPARRQGVLVP